MMKEDESVAIKKAEKQRSAAYPAINLEEAIKYSQALLLTYPTQVFSREAAAVEMGYKTLSGPAAGKIAALTHFGLTDRKELQV